MTKIVAFIQARMSSTRCPGKVLEPVGGMPLIAFMAERVRRARRVNQVVVVTSVDSSDDALVAALAEREIEVFRGDLNDVLSRYVCAADAYDATVAVRLTGDCPLADPAVIDQVIEGLLKSGADYASNVDPPTYADGLDVEVFTRAALAIADQGAHTPAEREHVTLWMRSSASNLRRHCQRGVINSSHLRLTVDYKDDLEVVRNLVDRLRDRPGGFDHYDLLRCLDQNPELLEINRHGRNEALSG